MRWSTYIGWSVAAWCAGFYAVVFVLAVAGVQYRFADSRSIALATLVVTGWGVLFTAWLTYLELYVIHAICRWCVVSASLTVVLFGLALSDWRKRFTLS